MTARPPVSKVIAPTAATASVSTVISVVVNYATYGKHQPATNAWSSQAAPLQPRAGSIRSTGHAANSASWIECRSSPVKFE
jgi:hypothetical protein